MRYTTENFEKDNSNKVMVGQRNCDTLGLFSIFDDYYYAYCNAFCKQWY